MARYNQTAIQDMLDGLRAAKAQIDALTKERDDARAENNMLRLQLVGKACYNCGGAINPQTMHCDECVGQDSALLARIAALEKAMRDMLADVEFHGHLTATAREHCAAVLAGGKETK